MLEQYTLAIRAFAIIIGLVFAAKGWRLYLRHLRTLGFVFGGTVGSVTGFISTGEWWGVLVFLALFGLAGFKIAVSVQKGLVLLSGAAVGAIFGGAVGYLSESVVPILIFTSIFAYVSWALHRATIIYSTALLGGVLLGIGFWHWIPVVLGFAGGSIYQYSQTTEADFPDDGTDSNIFENIGDLFTGGSAPISIRVIIALIIFFNIISILQIALFPSEIPSIAAQQQAILVPGLLTLLVLLPVALGLWKTKRWGWYAGMVVFSFTSLSAIANQSPTFLFGVALLFLLWRHRGLYFGDSQSETFKKISSENFP